MNIKEHPILLNTEMVEATIVGRKTITRRLNGMEAVNEYPDKVDLAGLYIREGENTLLATFCTSNLNDKEFDLCCEKYGDLTFTIKCPYGKPSDILYVREKFRYSQPYGPESLHYEYADLSSSVNEVTDDYKISDYDRWRPSIHMPKEAARIWLQITDIKVERIQSISNEDAIAEGIEPSGKGFKCYSKKYDTDLPPYWSFNSLWCSINGDESWDLNPWVWVIHFKVLSTQGRPEFIAQQSRKEVSHA